MKAFQARVRDSAASFLWYAGYFVDWLFTFRLKLTPILLHTVKNVLVVEMLYLGDLIALTPSLVALKKQLPHVKVTVMGNEEMKELLKDHPAVNHILPCSIDTICNNPEKVLASIRGKYDLAVLIHPHPRIGSKRMSKLLKNAAIPYRIGGTRVGIGEGKGYSLHRRAAPYFGLHHKAQDIADVFIAAGIAVHDLHPSLTTTKTADIWAKKFLISEKIKNKYIVFHPGPRHQSHAWFTERWAQLADQLQEKYHLPVLLTGSSEEKTLHSEIQKHAKKHLISASGTTLPQFCSLIKHASLVISVDTGAMHIAAAFQKPVIALFGAGNPQIWRPYTEHAAVIFKPQVHVGCMVHNCYLKGSRYMECMKAISVEEILTTIKNIHQ